jgi:hypothetical protein
MARRGRGFVWSGAFVALSGCQVLFGVDLPGQDEGEGGQGEAGVGGVAEPAGNGGAVGTVGAAGAGGAKASPAGGGGTGGVTSGGAGEAGASGGVGGGQSGEGGGGDVCAAPSNFQQTVKCDSFQGCKDTSKSCDQSDQSCEFDCSGQQGCENAKLQCPPNGDCRVTCANYQACVGTEVLCGSGVCEVVCQNDPEACKGMKDLQCRDASACRVRCEAEMNDPPAAAGCPDDAGLCPCNDPRCLP